MSLSNVRQNPSQLASFMSGLSIGAHSYRLLCPRKMMAKLSIAFTFLMLTMAAHLPEYDITDCMVSETSGFHCIQYYVYLA